MSKKIFKFETKKEKYLFFSIVVILFLLFTIMIYPAIKTHIISNKLINPKINQNKAELSLEPPKTPKEYYDMFQCSCCGKSIDVGCCGMAKQRKAYVDQLLAEGIEGNELIYRMVKKFGFDILMDQSKEQEIRDYILSQASDNPPKIDIENPKYDFGTIKQSEGIIITTFTVKNTGGSDLIIDNMDTSCGCTSVSLIYKGQEGPKFSMGMHGNNPKDYSLAIPPGESAQLKVYYDPMAHGKQKKPEMEIVRTVTIISNDPIDFQKKVRIELTQVP